MSFKRRGDDAARGDVGSTLGLDGLSPEVIALTVAAIGHAHKEAAPDAHEPAPLA